MRQTPISFSRSNLSPFQPKLVLLRSCQNSALYTSPRSLEGHLAILARVEAKALKDMVRPFLRLNLGWWRCSHKGERQPMRHQVEEGKGSFGQMSVKEEWIWSPLLWANIELPWPGGPIMMGRLPRGRFVIRASRQYIFIFEVVTGA